MSGQTINFMISFSMQSQLKKLKHGCLQFIQMIRKILADSLILNVN